MSSQITTITFFRFTSFIARLWALKMMRNAHGRLSKIEGLSFYKLLGTGRGLGFNPLPDFSTYSMLMVWDDQEHADRFFGSSQLFREYRHHSAERWTIFLRNCTSKGKWSGQQPFVSTASDENPGPIAVITRATIKPGFLISFWRYVPVSQKPIVDHPDLIYTKGIGEIPILQMATFSIWKSKAGLREFAYRSPEHRKAIAKTRELNWFHEELFARFAPYLSIGSWASHDPLDGLL